MAGKSILTKDEGETKKESRAPRQMCSSHPDRPAKHTTRSSAHWPISLCEQCLKASPHMGER